jgi:hypothetical protein
MSRSDDHDYRVAVHEASHAVVGRRCGMLCGGVTIDPDEDGSAFSITADPHAIQWHYEQMGRFISPEKIMRRRILTFMAGSEAENLIFGDNGGGDGDDRVQIEMMMAETTGSDDAGAAEKDLRHQARSAVRWFEGQIRRLAERLVAERTMTSERVDIIIGYVRPAPALSQDELEAIDPPVSIRRT